MTTTPRLLKPDETYCARCQQIFVNGDAYDVHLANRTGCATDNGLVRRGDVWCFPGRDRTHKPRRTPAQAAFDRIMTEVNYRQQFLNKNARRRFSDSDIEKVLAALERDRDR